jgi:hypothetical protein
MKYIINNTGIMLFWKGQPRKVNSDDHQYPAIIEALRLPNDEQEQAIEEIFIKSNPNHNMQEQGFVCEASSGDVYYRGEKLPAPLAAKVSSLLAQKLPVALLEKFWNNLCLNPSRNSIHELYDFLAYKELPITEDGCFLAYKGLRSDFYSVRGNNDTKVLQGTVDSQGCIYNGIGEVIEIARNSCDDNRENTCSEGIHVGSFDYAKDWSKGKLVVVKVNPKDVVSVPKDYDCQKMRCCAYEVMSEIACEITTAATDAQGGELKHNCFNEETERRNKFLNRIESYLVKKSALHDHVTVSAIQSIFSPECPSITEIISALGTLGYVWANSSKGKIVYL